MTSIPGLRPRVFYGLKTDIIGNVCFMTDHDIIYPAGCVLIIHNFTQKRQYYIHLPEKQYHYNIMCLAPNKKFIALAEKCEKPGISVYDVSTMKRKKTLSLPFETTATEFVSMCFSHDSKYLIVILGEPDWMMMCFNWEKGKMESSTKANNANNPGPVTQIACNPIDSSVVCIVGPGLFRLMSLTESVWRQYGYQKADLLTITCMCWLSFDRILCGTNDGRLIFIEFGELKSIYKALDVTVIDAKIKEEPTTLSEVNINGQLEDDLEVRELLAFPKGFAYSCTAGIVFLFEKETNFRYRKRNIFKIPPLTLLDLKKEINTVNCLCINLAGDTLIATTTGRTQLFTIRLWGIDMSQAPEISFQILGDDLHHGPILGLCICAWKPIFVTCGETDRTVRIWNYESETQELIKHFQEDVFSLALHPTGLYMLIGFSDKLRFMLLLIDDIHAVREFPIRNCSQVAFSLSGHMFAAVNGTMIQVYSSISYESIYTFKGHNRKIKSLMWTQTDHKLVSCGSEGALYEWNMVTGKRCGEMVTKACIFSGIAVSSDGKQCYGAGSDGHIKHISNSLIIRSSKILRNKLDYIVLSRSDLILYVSGDHGAILSVKVPLADIPERDEFIMHDHPVIKMAMTYDDQTLISCADDGSLCVWKLTFTEGKSIKIDKEFSHSNEILIGKDDLEEKIISIKDLTQRMKELETEHNYQMRQTEALHAEKTKEIHEGYCQAIEELKDKNEQLETEHTQEITVINTDIERMKVEHEQEVQTLEASFNAKLIVEYDKYQLFEEKAQRMKDDYENKLAELSGKREVDLKNLTDAYEAQLHEKNLQLEELHDESCQQAKEHEEMKQQIEEDADREIVEVKTQYEVLLKEERDANVRLRGETGVMKKKFISSQKEVDEFKHQVHQLQGEQQKFQQIIISLERDIMDLKKEISERDGTIQDKEKRIYDLKKKNQELEKFKFVLNYKIKELKNQIDPKDREIKEKKEQILDMEYELENLQKINTSLELQLVELREKLNGTDNELQAALRRGRETNALLHRIRIDLHDTAGLIQQPQKLKEAIRTLYHKYSQDPEFLYSRTHDVDVQQEFMRQREHLEHTVASLKKQVFKEDVGSKGEGAKIMEENITLITEINNLRRELKQSKRHIADMESILGLSSKHMSPKKAQARLEAAVKKTEDIHREYKNKQQDSERVIRVLKDEVHRLMTKLSTEDQIAHMQQQVEEKKMMRLSASNTATEKR